MFHSGSAGGEQKAANCGFGRHKLHASRIFCQLAAKLPLWNAIRRRGLAKASARLLTEAWRREREEGGGQLAASGFQAVAVISPQRLVSSNLVGRGLVRLFSGRRGFIDAVISASGFQLLLVGSLAPERVLMLFIQVTETLTVYPQPKQPVPAPDLGVRNF